MRVRQRGQGRDERREIRRVALFRNDIEQFFPDDVDPFWLPRA
jgi:hypothetical protein